MHDTATIRPRMPNITPHVRKALRPRGGTVEAGLPDGLWTVDPSESEIGFAVKGAWGLQTVRGVFRSYLGDLSVLNGDVDGHLSIEAASLDTGNVQRDRHLRSTDFFDVERYPRVVFSTAAVIAREGRLTVGGLLTVARSQVELQVPVEVRHHPRGGA